MDMAQDIVEQVEPFLSDDPSRWAKLSSDVQWRRMQLLLLREILVELRKLNQDRLEQPSHEPALRRE
jgi:hypothetical protein